MHWHEPEDIGPEQDRRDAAGPGRRFFVYVLATDYGHYVGHSGNLARIRAHMHGEVLSTVGGHPKRAWVSRHCSTCADAANFEAALKSWRDQRHPRFQEITGLYPIPYYKGRMATSESGPISDPVSVIAAIITTLAETILTILVGGLRLIFKGLIAGWRLRCLRR